jgi:hypothetical protein
MPIKSNCCDSPIAAKCMKCEKMCEVVEHQTSTWSAHYGFPYYITVGHLWWKKRVPNGWEDRGEIDSRSVPLPKDQWYTTYIFGEPHEIKTESRYRIHSECATRLHVGLENGQSFLYCPKCLVKLKP